MKVFRHILFFCFITIGFNAMYYVLFSYWKYDGKADWVPSPVFPIFTIIVYILSVFYIKHIVKRERKIAFLYSIGIVILFIICSSGITNVVDKKYSFLLKDYYRKMPYETLLHWGEYTETKGNYAVVIDALNEKGIKINRMVEGNSDNTRQNGEMESKYYTKTAYLINDASYVVFDWDNQKITTMMKKEKIENMIREEMKIKQVKEMKHLGSTVYIEKQNGETELYKVIPNRDNAFTFSLIQ